MKCEQRQALATRRAEPHGPLDAVTRQQHVQVADYLKTNTSSRETMPICIECRYPVSSLYTTYSKADDRTLGKGVRLTQCPRCKRFADKYVEHDFVVLFIDLVLIKPQVGLRLQTPFVQSSGPRRWSLQRTSQHAMSVDQNSSQQPSIIRLGVLLLLFDVYLTWARIEEAMPSSSATDTISMPTPSDPFAHPSSNATGSSDSSTSGLLPNSYLLSEQPIMLQYVFFLLLCALETVSFHLPIRTLLSLRLPRPLSYLIPHYPHPAVISTALLVSSFTKLFPLLLLIWKYDLPSSASAVSWAVIINNVAALEILLECGVIRAAILAAVGAVCRAGVGWVSFVTVQYDGLELMILQGILRAAGVGSGVAAAGVVETSDLLELWKRLALHVGIGQ
ncbi:ARV1-like protein [Aureobasidium sp. EXF-10728]|nr:ARV1-like protein [Aureobasidium sp. EXF-10728]